MIVDILLWALFGLVAGMLAQFLMPGKDPGESADLKGYVITTLLGIAGAMVGGYIAHSLGLFGAAGQEAGVLNWRTLLAAVCGSLLLLLAYRAVRMLAGYGTPAVAPAATAYGLKSATSGYGSDYDGPASTNLTDTVKNAVTPDVVQKLSSVIGENPVNTRKALDAMIPTIVAGVANQASTTAGASRLFDMAKESISGSGNVINNLAGHITGAGLETVERTGQGFLSSIFGDKLSSILGWFAKFAGIKSTAATSLMGVASNLVMNVLGKQIVNNGLNISSFGNLLSGQKSWLSRLLPSGLSDIPGLNTLTDYVGQAGSAVRGAAEYGERSVRGAAREVSRVGATAAQDAKPWLSALAPLLLLGLLAGTLPFLMRGCATTTPTGGPVARATTEVKLPDVKLPDVKGPIVHVAGYRPDLTKLVTVKLPDGANLEIPELSFVHDVHKYLADTAGTKTRSFVFDSLNFEGPTIKSASETDTVVKVLSTILKHYPNATIRIDAHTDRSRDADADRRVTRERAMTVRDLIVKAGIPADRVGTEGFGSEKPIVPNDTEENRAKNRRIELTIEKK